MTDKGQVLNFINGKWRRSSASEYLDIINPATAQAMSTVPLSPGGEVDMAVRAGMEAFPEWRRTPVEDRIQHLFALKVLLEDNIEDLARVITHECGKTYTESIGELRRGIEDVEVACGAPILMQG